MKEESILTQVLSDRVLHLEEPQTLGMAKKARELASKGINVIKLSLGEPDFHTPEHIKEAAKKAIDENFSFYTPVPGIPELRQAIAEKLSRENDLHWKAENIVVSTGAKQSLINAILSIVNPGDEVIIFSPYWVTYTEQVKLAEGVPVTVDALVENGFKVKPEDFRAAITPRTKALLFSSPNNPTGATYTKEELRAFADIVAENEQMYVIADEIYEYITFIDQYFSIGAFDSIRDRVITINGYSKGFAMTGWRLGYMAANKAIADACEKIQGQFTSATCSIAQKAALAATTGDLGPTRVMKEAYLQRRNLILNLMKDIPGIKTYVPEGAFYLFPDVSEYYGKSNGEFTVHNSDDMCMYLLNYAHVALVPGSAFGAPACIRISYAASDADITEAVQRIKNYLGQLK